MNLRTLSREHSIHLTNLACMILAWSATLYYFDAVIPATIEFEVGRILLTPVFLIDQILNTFSNETISGNPFRMFLVLWISYSIPALKFAPALIVRNHRIADLKEWYKSRVK